jgi:hypothetical protein
MTATIWAVVAAAAAVVASVAIVGARLRAALIAQVRAGQAQAAQPAPTPSYATATALSPVKDPKWAHQTLVLKIGEHEYSFRTLSFYDVWTLWPHIFAVKEMLARGRPLTMMAHLKEIMTWVAPVLAANDADCKEFHEIHANLVMDFYRSQDWARMETLGRNTTDSGAEEGLTKEEAHQRFIAVCATAAQYAGMDVGTFVQQRFEFCADQIIAANRAISSTQERDRPESWGEVVAKLAVQMRGAVRTIDPEKKPDWMKAMEGEPN